MLTRWPPFILLHRDEFVETLSKIPIFKSQFKKEADALDEEDKENVRPAPAATKYTAEIPCFRPPDPNSATLFDPNLLAAFEQALEQHKRAEEEEFLFGFEEKCPPGGSECVILYTTTIRGVRKTFEECRTIRFVLESFGVRFYERDVWMHSEYKDELRNVLGGDNNGTVPPPPRLFVKGRDIGGAEEVLRLHEQGKLKLLFHGIPSMPPSCQGCAGFKFLVCFQCNGSRRVIQEDGLSTVCQHCNENGLVICPFCS
ncbi:uncharacterized protein At5g39865-like [Mercurialis annua]|uniref:uncharacterized protein At5g39865-like n=1 Tax=Mercurialis annua TaxID=3986 RepID=UPI0021601EB8|nr:uncharacterized protein At5g39865-like [Mercurialis annua]